MFGFGYKRVATPFAMKGELLHVKFASYIDWVVLVLLLK